MKNGIRLTGEQMDNQFDTTTRVREFILSLIIDVTFYLPSVARELPNPDAIWNSTVYKSGYLWEIACGRYMLPVWAHITGYAVSPATFTALGLAAVVGASIIILDLLDIKNVVLRYLSISII